MLLKITVAAKLRTKKSKFVYLRLVPMKLKRISKKYIAQLKDLRDPLVGSRTPAAKHWFKKSSEGLLI